MEENKTAKLTLEINQLKGETEKRLLERDEESDKDRLLLNYTPHKSSCRKIQPTLS